jgi:hypothetical protein
MHIPKSNQKGFWTPYISRTTQPIELKFFVDPYTNKFYAEKNFQAKRLNPWYSMKCRRHDACSYYCANKKEKQNTLI